MIWFARAHLLKLRSDRGDSAEMYADTHIAHVVESAVHTDLLAGSTWTKRCSDAL